MTREEAEKFRNVAVEQFSRHNPQWSLYKLEFGDWMFVRRPHSNWVAYAVVKEPEEEEGEGFKVECTAQFEYGDTVICSKPCLTLFDAVRHAHQLAQEHVNRMQLAISSVSVLPVAVL